MAKNNAPTIKDLKKELRGVGATALGWSVEDEQEFFRMLEDRRHKQIAHYDGRQVMGDPLLEGMPWPGANLTEEERADLGRYLGAMLAHLNRKLVPRD